MTPTFFSQNIDNLNILFGITNLDFNFVDKIYCHMFKMDYGVLYPVYLSIYDLDRYRVTQFINYLRFCFPQPMWPYIHIFHYIENLENMQVEVAIRELTDRIEIDKLKEAVDHLVRTGVNFKDYVIPVKHNAIPH